MLPILPQFPTKTARVLERVKHVTQELESIQNEIYGELAEADGTPRKHSALITHGAAGDLGRFKVVVDQLRRVLWFYIADAAAGQQEIPESERQAHRLQRATELLQAIAPQPGMPAADQPPGSFFERLNVVIDGYMQASGKPAASAPSKGQKASD